MSQVEIVALWSGLLSSVVGIVLSIVAIVFTWVVNKRADRIGDHTIQSLQRIESSVAALSDSTTGLIKAAWEKMLGNVGIEGGASVTAGRVKELAGGIVAEIRSELETKDDDGSAATGEGKRGARSDRIERSLDQLQEALRALAGSRANAEPSLLDHVVSEAKSITPEARELFFALRKGHLTNQQYKDLMQSSLSDAVSELRSVGLMVPRTGARNEELVYYYPSGVHRVIDVAKRLLPPTSPEAQETVGRELKKVGHAKSRDRSREE